MKTFTLTVMFTVAMMMSCQKENDSINDYIDVDYYYRLAMIDIDETVKYSPVLTTKVNQIVEIAGTANSGGGGDHDDENEKDYCIKHPKSPRCRPLPVVLEYFVISKKDHTVTLKWKSDTEDNFDRYVVERSRNAIEFKPIATIKPKGPSEYVYQDVFK